MIAGVGTDIVEVARISRGLTRFGQRFGDRILTTKERRSFNDPERLAAYIARQFAAKEAVAKALGTGMRQGVHFQTIEVTRMSSGAPKVSLLAGAAERARALGVVKIHLSISDERHYALAFAVAETQAVSD